MWQHLLNILLGAGLMLVSYTGSEIGTISHAYAWTFGIIGLIILAASVWGLIDEVYYEQLHPRLETGM
jgi:hypothetical protein